MQCADKETAPKWLAALVIASAVCAYVAVLVLPLRIAFAEAPAYYRFGYVVDEYNYVSRISPLCSGATPLNPCNGFGDKNLISPFFLEDTCRFLTQALHINTITFMWLWRLAYPLALLAALASLARACFHPPPQFPRLTCLAAAAGALTVMYVLYYVLVDHTLLGLPLHRGQLLGRFCFLNRIPTNLEFILSVWLCAQYVRFVAAPKASAGVMMALTGVVTGYFRPYAAVPWAVAIAFGLLWMLWQRRVRFVTLIPAVIAAALAAAPYLLIVRYDSASADFRDMLVRAYSLPFPYTVHSRWPLFVALAVALLIWARWLPPSPCPLPQGERVGVRGRLAVVTGALSLAVLPFICGALYPIAYEMVNSDRFSCVYLPLLATAAFMALCGPGEQATVEANAPQCSPGRLRLHCAVGLSCAAFAAAVLIVVLSVDYDRYEYGPVPPAFTREDVRYHKGYAWVRANTPAEALFLVDDGVDFSRLTADKMNDAEMAFRAFHGDLFGLLAARRTLFAFSLYLYALDSKTCLELNLLQWATLGLPVEQGHYQALVARYPFDYIFWRKHPPVWCPEAKAPVPRGQGRSLERFAEKVYSDEACEVWDLRKLAAANREHKGF